MSATTKETYPGEALDTLFREAVHESLERAFRFHRTTEAQRRFRELLRFRVKEARTPDLLNPLLVKFFADFPGDTAAKNARAVQSYIEGKDPRHVVSQFLLTLACF